MRRLLLSLSLLAALWSGDAQADGFAVPVASCGTLTGGSTFPLGGPQPLTQNQNGQLCISGTINASSSLNAASTLPTLTAGAQSFQGSLAGALYVQEAFGTASGGGTQVDATHGLPVSLIASSATVTVSGTVTTTPPSNASTNLTQVGGSAIALGQTTMASSIPVALASNQSNLGVTQQTSPWVDNVSQFGGSNVVTGTGASGSGIPRVTVSNDSTVILGAGAATIGALTANQSVNVAQINGVTPLMGNGTTGTGSPRVTISSDNSAAAGIGGSATGSAVPASARYIGGNGSGNLTGIPVCDNWTPISQTGNTKLVSGAATKQTYICHVHVVTATAQNVALLSGTGSTCGTSPHAIAGGTTAATGWNFAANAGIVIGTGVGAPLRTGTAADDVCLFQSGAGQVSGEIQWTQL